MAWVKTGTRADGTTAHTVRYVLGDGTQTSATFDVAAAAAEFCDTVNAIGPDKAMLAWGIAPTTHKPRSRKPTVATWVRRYIDSRTGVVKSTIADYESYLRHDITPKLGPIPIDLLTPADVSEWVNWLASRDCRHRRNGQPVKLSGKSIANRHGFLSAALRTAVADGQIGSNPAAGTRIPRTERAEMCFLTHEEFAILAAAIAPEWRPMLWFMVASGARLGEVTALRPSDVDRGACSVHIGRAWKRTYDATQPYELGATKTKKSVRTIIVPRPVLDQLDYTGEFLFADDGPVRPVNFRKNVWYPALDRASKAGMLKRPRIHDMRHTCASWMIAGGADMYAVQRHLGHESITTTVGRYVHLDTRQAREAADIISAALGE